MDRKTVTQEATRLGLQVLALVLVYSLVLRTGLHRFTSHETEGLNTLIVMVGSIYAVILAFAIFVIWGQFTDVENCVMRECNSLHDLLRFSRYIGEEPGRTVRRALAAYTQQVVRHEWQALGDGRRDKRAGELFSELMNAVIAGGTPGSSALTENPAHLRLIDMARRAGERRDERVTKSLTRIPPTMFWFVNMIAGALLLLVIVYPFHQWAAGLGCVVLVGVVLFLANFVMRDMDNPIQGAWNVSPGSFVELQRV